MLSAFILATHSYSALHLAAQLIHQRCVRPGPLVLRSRAIVLCEHPNRWDLPQPQDVTNRHRGAKPPRRYELLGEISLLSPEYLLSFERRPFHTEPPDHYSRLSSLLGSCASQSSTLLLMRSSYDYQPY